MTSPVKRARKYLEAASVLNFRITPATRKLLVQAARTHGQTVSAECEFQLQRALSDLGNTQTNAIMALIAHAIDGMIKVRAFDEKGKEERRITKWWNDAYTYGQVEHVVVSALRMFRPRGPAPYIDPVRPDFSLNSTVYEMQMTDETVPFENKNRMSVD